MEMMNVGHKREAPIGEGKDKNRISYPSFSLEGDAIPEELKNAKVGETCRCEIVIKKTGDSINTYGNQKARVELEIHKLGYIGKASKMNKEEYLNASDEERAKNDKENMETEEQDEGSKEEKKEGE